MTTENIIVVPSDDVTIIVVNDEITSIECDSLLVLGSSSTAA